MRVLAALSGGVDSAVAAARAVDAGHEVVGVHMALTRNRAQTRSGSRGCCSIEDSADARWAAQILGIPFYVWDLSEEFEERVVDDFLTEYRAGRTPNPCVRCNERVKFDALLERALALGFDAVAMSPGRQLGVGTVEGTPIFCLPGDPVSAQIAFETFVRPVLRQIAGRTSLHRSSLAATISEGWHSPSGKREFVPVHVSGSPSRGYRAEPTTPPGTVRLHGLSEANAIAVVPEDTSTVVAGDTLHCLLLDA